MEFTSEGPILVNKPLKIVAPMVSMSELAWRMFMRKHNTDLCYTPMLNAAIFIRDPIYRKTYMEVDPEDRPLVVQFCANDPEIFTKAIKLVENVCDAVELNLGCPQIIAQKGHYGSYLQEEWELISQMVSLATKSTKLPIFCKIRIFENLEKTIQYAQMIEKSGCKLLTVHGRTREQKGHNTGLANWDTIVVIRKTLNIPVVANGNFQYFEDFNKCIEYTNCVGVMSAEGCLSNPYIFETTTLPNAIQVSLEYLDYAEKYNAPVLNWRGHLYKMLYHVLNKFFEYRKTISTCNTFDEARRFIRLLESLCETDIISNKEPKYWLCSPIIRGNNVCATIEHHNSDDNSTFKQKYKETIIENRKRRKEHKFMVKEKARLSKSTLYW